ncbi:3-isopropylmalate dehydratase, partial [candidate division MSBL1 archaeon SCGC-AAA259D14]
EIGMGGAAYQSVRYAGPAVKGMDIGKRMTLSNLVIDIGAKNGIFEPDEKTRAFLKNRMEEKIDFLSSDRDAEFVKTHSFQVEDLEPQIAYPHQVDKVKPISEAEGIKIDQVFLGTCTNGRYNDLKAAAHILNGRKVNSDTRMIINPASREVYLRSMREGLLEIFLKSGCVINNPGCGPCAGSHQGILASGEKCLSTGNRNFQGRMGTEDTEIYLSSPTTAAATAIEGRITDPRKT